MIGASIRTADNGTSSPVGTGFSKNVPWSGRTNSPLAAPVAMRFPCRNLTNLTKEQATRCPGSHHIWDAAWVLLAATMLGQPVVDRRPNLVLGVLRIPQVYVCKVERRLVGREEAD